MFADLSIITGLFAKRAAVRCCLTGKDILTSVDYYERIVYLCRPQVKKTLPNMSRKTGKYVTREFAGEKVNAFLPFPLPQLAGWRSREVWCPARIGSFTALSAKKP